MILVILPVQRTALLAAFLTSLTVLNAQEQKGTPSPAVIDRGDSIVFHPKENYSDLNDLILDYMASNGGRSYLEEQKSIRMIGNYTEGGTKMEITTFRKRPNYVRTNFQSDQYKLSLGYDGVVVWQSLERSGLVTSGQLSGPDADEVKRHSYFLHPFYNLRETAKWLTFVGKEKFANRDCWRVDMKSEDSHIKFYHSCDNLNELGSVGAMLVDGKEVTVEIRKEDYRLVDRMVLPHKVTTIRDGKVAGVYEFSTMSVNHGLTDSYFRKPAPRFNR